MKKVKKKRRIKVATLLAVSLIFKISSLSCWIIYLTSEDTDTPKFSAYFAAMLIDAKGHKFERKVLATHPKLKKLKKLLLSKFK